MSANPNHLCPIHSSAGPGPCPWCLEMVEAVVDVAVCATAGSLSGGAGSGCLNCGCSLATCKRSLARLRRALNGVPATP